MISAQDVHSRFAPSDTHARAPHPRLFIAGGRGSNQPPPRRSHAHLSRDRAWYARFWSLLRGGGLRPNLPPVPRPRGDWFRGCGPGSRLARAGDNVPCAGTGGSLQGGGRAEFSVCQLPEGAMSCINLPNVLPGSPSKTRGQIQVRAPGRGRGQGQGRSRDWWEGAGSPGICAPRGPK